MSQCAMAACGLPSSWMSARGWTLLETMVAIGLIGMFTAVAGSQLRPGLDFAHLERAAGTMAADVRSASTRAAAQEKPRQMVITGTGYRIERALATCRPGPGGRLLPDDSGWEPEHTVIWPQGLEATVSVDGGQADGGFPTPVIGVYFGCYGQVVSSSHRIQVKLALGRQQRDLQVMVPLGRVAVGFDANLVPGNPLMVI